MPRVCINLDVFADVYNFSTPVVRLEAAKTLSQTEIVLLLSHICVSYMCLHTHMHIKITNNYGSYMKYIQIQIACIYAYINLPIHVYYTYDTKQNFQLNISSYGCQIHVTKENSSSTGVIPSAVNINHILFFTIYLQPIKRICMNICFLQTSLPKAKAPLYFLYSFFFLICFCILPMSA